MTAGTLWEFISERKLQLADWPGRFGILAPRNDTILNRRAKNRINSMKSRANENLARHFYYLVIEITLNLLMLIWNSSPGMKRYGNLPSLRIAFLQCN